MKRSIKIFLLTIFFALCCIILYGANIVRAGFGIGPPYIKNDQLVPGSHYEQQIMLLRSSAEEELQAEITINAPEIKDWITIDKGFKFMLPKGELQVPMIVRIDSPKNAELGNYKGYINIRVAPPENKQKSGVAIALGARIDIDLSLTNVSFADFKVKMVSIPDIEMLGKPWNWRFWSFLFNKLFYRIQIIMNIENIGNVPTAPSRVTLEVYDITENNQLESSEDNNIKKISAFSTGQTIASFPTKLQKGYYWAKVKIYKDNEIVNSYKINFAITAPGELGSKARNLGIWPWIVAGGIFVSLLIIIFILIKIKIWRYIFSILKFIIIKPLSPVGRKILMIKNNIAQVFWRWIRVKAEQKTKKNDDKK